MSSTKPSPPHTPNADAQLETLLLEALAPGEDIPLTPKFWQDLRAEAAQLRSAARLRLAVES